MKIVGSTVNHGTTTQIWVQVPAQCEIIHFAAEGAPLTAQKKKASRLCQKQVSLRSPPATPPSCLPPATASTYTHTNTHPGALRWVGLDTPLQCVSQRRVPAVCEAACRPLVIQGEHMCCRRMPPAIRLQQLLGVLWAPGVGTALLPGRLGPDPQPGNAVPAAANHTCVLR